ncbi:PREDICTED: uncharacterized protein LOC109485843, partial [Branchiostoma belcheri]|uniref:Uncharacterized protein LOC109485843 n=1 Tax=Branchiostoma belcheri TaxID=7741 RepID=A0A6P5AFG0_BRABE
MAGGGQRKTSSGGKIRKPRKKQRFSALNALSHAKRGVGKGSRSRTFVPPVGYTVTAYEKSQVMTTPGKHRYRSVDSAAETVRERGFNKSLIFETSSEEDQPSTSANTESTPCEPTTSSPLSEETLDTSASTWKAMAKSMFIAYGDSVGYLIDQVNAKRNCSTKGCNGILVPWKTERVGLGGNLRAVFMCTGCKGGGVTFDASTYLREEKRQVAGHSLALSFILNGNTYEKYNQALHLGLGIPIFSFNTYYNILSKAYPHVHNILDVQMKKARANMKEMDPTKVGSWKRAVTSGDGVYHTRGHHSKNMSVLLVDYCENALLAAVHLCMRGKDVTTADSVPLFPGTSKSAEGYGFELIWEELKHEGMEVEVHWQDADSTSEKSFKKFFSKSKVMYCGGHVGRAHGKQLEKLASMKTFSKGYKQRHSTYELDKLKCVCINKHHSATCGCIRPNMIKQAKINHFAALVQSGTDAALYAKRMRALGQHHARNIHEWKDGSCDFHGKKRCSCKKCDPLDVQCTGEMYKTSHPLTCPMHSMAYEIECEERAAKAKDVIHPEMGRGHSNYPEARNNVLIRYRSKSISLNRLAYCLWTDVGLLQGNMSWCFREFGPAYHWIVEVYRAMELPVPE